MMFTTLQKIELSTAVTLVKLFRSLIPVTSSASILRNNKAK